MPTWRPSSVNRTGGSARRPTCGASPRRCASPSPPRRICPGRCRAGRLVRSPTSSRPGSIRNPRRGPRRGSSPRRSSRSSPRCRTISRSAAARNLLRRMDRRTSLAAGTLLGALVLAALHLWRGIEYWNYSEGVYAYTSRLLLRGGDLYGHTVVAQPPWQFLFGAGALAIRDSLTFLRLAVGVAQLGAGVLAGAAVWRLTEHPWATLIAPALTLLT